MDMDLNLLALSIVGDVNAEEVRRLMETETAFDAGLWRKFAEQGWTGIIFPEKYDGSGLGVGSVAPVTSGGSGPTIGISEVAKRSTRRRSPANWYPWPGTVTT